MSKSNSAAAVLILSADFDVHASTVSEHLTEFGVAHKYLRFDDFLNACLLRFALTNEDTVCMMRLPDGDDIDLSALSSIWFRRPGAPRSVSLIEPWMERLMAMEATSALGGIFRSLSCLMVNHPGRDSECLYKIWQLQAAKRVGLAVPATLVTNDPQRARQFYDECERQVVYKFIGENANHAFPRSHVVTGIPTLCLYEDDLPHLDQVKYGPHLFQQHVKKRFDVRVTAVGKQLFAGRIDSQSGEGATDWRMDYRVPMEKYDLPEEVAEQCLSLLRLLGLNYGAIDLCVDEENRHIFLECNCAGQYMWMEMRTEMPISLELAKLLAGKVEPLCR